MRDRSPERGIFYTKSLSGSAGETASRPLSEGCSKSSLLMAEPSKNRPYRTVL